MIKKPLLKGGSFTFKYKCFLNGPTPVSFCSCSIFSNTNFIEKTVGIGGIQTHVVGLEGKRADYLNTTTTL